MSDKAAPSQGPSHSRLGAPFEDGTALTNAVAVSKDVFLGSNVAAWRLRWQSTCAGTLSFAYLRPLTPASLYTAAAGGGAPANVSVAANTEAIVTVDPHLGEGGVRITFTPSANGAITFADIMTVPRR